CYFHHAGCDFVKLVGSRFTFTNCYFEYPGVGAAFGEQPHGDCFQKDDGVEVADVTVYRCNMNCPAFILHPLGYECNTSGMMFNGPGTAANVHFRSCWILGGDAEFDW